ncbi:MAG: glycosyltransferase family 2 protein [bacterium]|nr:glycosyltransferase family 2 protein [bacterium]
MAHSGLLSIIIPSRNEIFLQKTVEDILAKATGEIEIIVVLDGYWPNPQLKDDQRVIVLHRGKVMGMRAGINSAAALAKGKYLMKCDAHCMFAPGFDRVLAADCDDNWVVVPRRYRLDAEKWEIEQPSEREPAIDYQYIMYPGKFRPPSLHGFRWDNRTQTRKDISVDDLLSFQGSCWYMTKRHFEKHGFLTIEGYQGLPQQEAEEIELTTWLSGGRVVVNKKTWYAHMFKGAEHGRGYFVDERASRACYEFSYHHWVNENKEGFIKLIEKFWPLPGWPENWQERLYS